MSCNKFRLTLLLCLLFYQLSCFVLGKTKNQTFNGFQLTNLLLKVAPLLLIDENQVEVVAHRKLLVDVPHGRRHLVARKEQPDGDGLSYRTASHRLLISEIHKVTR